MSFAIGSGQPGRAATASEARQRYLLTPLYIIKFFPVLGLIHFT